MMKKTAETSHLDLVGVLSSADAKEMKKHIEERREHLRKDMEKIAKKLQ